VFPLRKRWKSGGTPEPIAAAHDDQATLPRPFDEGRRPRGRLSLRRNKSVARASSACRAVVNRIAYLSTRIHDAVGAAAYACNA